MTTKYHLPVFIIPRMIYKGRVVSPQFYNENPDLFRKHPSRKEIANFSKKMLRNSDLDPSKYYDLVVDETGMRLQEQDRFSLN